MDSSVSVTCTVVTAVCAFLGAVSMASARAGRNRYTEIGLAEAARLDPLKSWSLPAAPTAARSPRIATR